MLISGAFMLAFKVGLKPLSEPTPTNYNGWILTGTNAVAIGVNAVARFDNAIAIGSNAIAHETNELVIRYYDGTEFRMILKTNINFGW